MRTPFQRSCVSVLLAVCFIFSGLAPTIAYHQRSLQHAQRPGVIHEMSYRNANDLLRGLFERSIAKSGDDDQNGFKLYYGVGAANAAIPTIDWAAIAKAIENLIEKIKQFQTWFNEWLNLDKIKSLLNLVNMLSKLQELQNAFDKIK